MNSDSDWRISCPTIRDKQLHLLNSGKLSDVVFVIGDTKERIHAHKFILIVGSPVFETVFKNRRKMTIEIPGVSPNAFRMFLQYLYADLFSVTENEAPDVLFLAQKYLTNSLVKKCTDFLSSVISVSNVIRIHQTATKFSENNLEKEAMEFILLNGSAVFEDTGFLQIDKDTLSSVLKSDKLVTEEIDIFRALMRWAVNKCKEEKLGYTLENKRLILKDLISLIRFTLMTPEEFTNEVCVGKHEGILSEAESISVYKYLNVGSSTRKRKRLPPLPFIVKKRCHENLYKVDVYEAGVGQFRGLNCRNNYTGSSTTRCMSTLRFRSNRTIQMMGIELRQPTQLTETENPMNSTYLAITDPESDTESDTESDPESAPEADLVSAAPVLSLSDISAEIYRIRKSCWWNSEPDGRFVPVPMPLASGFESSFQIVRNVNYNIILNTRGGSGNSSIKAISPGVGLKLGNPAQVNCEEDDVEFQFEIDSTHCFWDDCDDDKNRSSENCISTGLIKAIHFKI